MTPETVLIKTNQRLLVDTETTPIPNVKKNTQFEEKYSQPCCLSVIFSPKQNDFLNSI
jgi:hypothetical protein